jgi:hypothetical protein
MKTSTILIGASTAFVAAQTDFPAGFPQCGVSISRVLYLLAYRRSLVVGLPYQLLAATLIISNQTRLYSCRTQCCKRLRTNTLFHDYRSLVLQTCLQRLAASLTAAHLISSVSAPMSTSCTELETVQTRHVRAVATPTPSSKSVSATAPMLEFLSRASQSVARL